MTCPLRKVCWMDQLRRGDWRDVQNVINKNKYVSYFVIIIYSLPEIG